MITFIAIAVAIVVVLMVLAFRRGMPRAENLDLGAVSTRWLSELRRDEPWTRS